MKKDATCKTLVIHPEIVEKVRQTTPPEEELYDLSDFFKILADSSRMKILHALFISEMCVCDLASVIGASQSAVSHQLKTLRQMSFVKYRKEGKTVFYSLKDKHISQIVTMAKEHLLES